MLLRLRYFVVDVVQSGSGSDLVVSIKNAVAVVHDKREWKTSPLMKFLPKTEINFLKLLILSQKQEQQEQVKS